MRRYYALLLYAGGKVRLVKALDGDRVLAEADFGWEAWKEVELTLQVEAARLRSWVDGNLFFDVIDEERTLDGGAVALICEEGHVRAHEVSVTRV